MIQRPHKILQQWSLVLGISFKLYLLLQVLEKEIFEMRVSMELIFVLWNNHLIGWLKDEKFYLGVLRLVKQTPFNDYLIRNFLKTLPFGSLLSTLHVRHHGSWSSPLTVVLLVFFVTVARPLDLASKSPFHNHEASTGRGLHHWPWSGPCSIVLWPCPKELPHIKIRHLHEASMNSGQDHWS